MIRGEGFGSKYKPYFTWEMAEEFDRCSVGNIRLFFVVFFVQLPACNRWYRVFLDYKLTKLERGSQQTPYYKISFEAVFGKVFYTNARMLPRHEAFSLYFYKSFSLKFWVLGELESANF